MSEIRITNMHYYFHHDYYDFLEGKIERFKNYTLAQFSSEELRENSDKKSPFIFEKKHIAITSYSYEGISSDWIKNNINENNMNYMQDLTGTVQYPGLLLGTGYTHSLGAKSEIVMGFSFDYVTGLPYLPGSSLKGILKDKFQYGEYILENLKNVIKKDLSEDENKKNEEIDLIMKELIKAIFGDENVPGADVFMDSYIQSKENKNILKMDYLAPHNQEMNKTSDQETKSNPDKKKKLFDVNVLTMIRVAPDTKINLNFILKDSSIKEIKNKDGIIILNSFVLEKDVKLALFKQILSDFGIGAKTNVGYGNLVFE